GVRARAASPAGLIVFEGRAPSDMVESLGGDRLLATVTADSGRWTFGALRGVISPDSGRSWGEPFSYLQRGKPLAAAAFPARPLVRLRSGELGLVYSSEERSSFGYPLRQWFFATSRDGGKTWGPGHAIDAPATWDQDGGVYLQF